MLNNIRTKAYLSAFNIALAMLRAGERGDYDNRRGVRLGALANRISSRAKRLSDEEALDRARFAFDLLERSGYVSKDKAGTYYETTKLARTTDRLDRDIRPRDCIGCGGKGETSRAAYPGARSLRVKAVCTRCRGTSIDPFITDADEKEVVRKEARDVTRGTFEALREEVAKQGEAIDKIEKTLETLEVVLRAQWLLP